MRPSMKYLHICEAEHFATQAADKGAFYDSMGKVGLGSIEALRSAPKMWGLTGPQIRRESMKYNNWKVVGRKKLESGKHRRQKTRLFWVPDYRLKTRSRTKNNAAYTGCCYLSSFAPGAWGHTTG